MKRGAAFLCALSLGLVPIAANAAVIVDIQEVGPNVIAQVGGSLNLSGLTFVNSVIFDGGGSIRGDSAFYIGGADILSQAYSGFTGPASFGPGSSPIAGSSAFARTFGFNAAYGAFGAAVFVPFEYVSSTVIASGAVFAGQSLSSLGLAPGTYVYTAPSDSVTFIIGTPNATTGTPEPSTWAVMLLGFVVIGWGVRRQRRLQLHFDF